MRVFQNSFKLVIEIFVTTNLGLWSLQPLWHLSTASLGTSVSKLYSEDTVFTATTWILILADIDSSYQQVNLHTWYDNIKFCLKLIVDRESLLIGVYYRPYQEQGPPHFDFLCFFRKNEIRQTNRSKLQIPILYQKWLSNHGLFLLPSLLCKHITLDGVTEP